MNWLNLSVVVPRAQADAVVASLEGEGALSVSLLDALDEVLVEPVPGETPLWEQVRVVALFPGSSSVESLQQVLCSRLPEVPLHIQVEPLADRDWISAWRDNFRPMQFGSRLWVCPSGTQCPQDDGIVVWLDPGAAFGTGTHATTALCLEWLDRHPPAGQAVIDYGCGSGILAIAAARLGAARVAAVDIDARAVDVTRENALLNGVSGNLVTGLPGESALAPAHLVIANILANPLQELASQLCDYLLPGGRILLTGILEHQAETVQQAYRHRVVFEAPRQRDEWVLLSGTRRSCG